MHRLLVPWLAATALAATALAGCGSVEYRDTNAAVDVDPLCTSQPDRPGEPGALRCERKTETTIAPRREPPLDLSGAREDDDPR